MIVRWLRNRRVRFWRLHAEWLAAERRGLPPSPYRDQLDAAILAAETKIKDLSR